MFTIKLMQDSRTDIVNLDVVEIYKDGAAEWSEAHQLAGSHNVSTPRLISSIYLDDDEGEVVEDINVISRDSATKSEYKKPCLAILRISEHTHLSPEIPKDNIGGFGYVDVFIYKGDQMYIMNQSGATVEVIK